jgi:hypothetical protein
VVEPVRRRRPYQFEPEIDAFIALMNELGARSFLEIGSKYGGTLWRVAHGLPAGSRIVSVDLDTNGPELRRVIAALNAEGYDAHLIVGDSTNTETIRKASELGPFDVLFIDGNHKLEYVRSDWESYGLMSCMVGFHDIGWKRPSPEALHPILVSQLWNEIKGSYRHQEIMLHPVAYGIGVLWRTGAPYAYANEIGACS